MLRKLLAIGACAALAASAGVFPKKKSAPEPSALDRYVQEAMRGAGAAAEAPPGSLWTPQAALLNLTSELRASHVDDIVTILVAEQASAVATGATKTGRASSASAAVNALGGVTRAAGPWANLANLSGKSSLDGSGSTSRNLTLSTTLTARVTHVLPNGYLVVEGTKDMQVNSERQTVTVRGVVRPADLSTVNVVRSNHLGQMEIRLNGKGVVGDAVRRPMFLYRLLMGLLPF
jgi:flagellar L-ring protein precursor FlgH